MMKYRSLKLAGAVSVGLLLLAVFPTNVNAIPTEWVQDTPAEFNAGTFTDLDLYVDSANAGWIHLEDDGPWAPYYWNYTGNASDSIWDSGSGNNLPVGTWSEVFVTCIENAGTVDIVDARIWKVSPNNPKTNPKDSYNNDATLTISIVDCDQQSKVPTPSSVLASHTFSANEVSFTSGTYTWHLTTADSGVCKPLLFSHWYCLYVTSNSVNPIATGDAFVWDMNPNWKSDICEGYQKKYDNNGDVTWVYLQAYNHPFCVYSHKFKESGTFVSSVHDCGQDSSFSSVWFSAVYGGNGGASTTIYARTGSTSTPNEQDWTEWVDEGTGSWNPGLMINRYVQYKLEFTYGDSAAATNSVNIVVIEYDTMGG